MKTPLFILLAEDEPAHAEAICRAFEDKKGGAEIRTAGTLRQFREMAAERAPDIAIMDINLPDGRASEALSSPPESGLFPIIIMTSYGNEEIAVETMKAGALDYVVKSTESFADMPRIAAGALREWDLLIGRKSAEETIKHEQELYIDLAKSLPVGIYRVRVFPPQTWKKDAWLSSENAPYSMEMVNDRFCEILGVSKEAYTKNPGILNDLVHPEEKAVFAKANEDANSHLSKFHWEGRIVNEGKIRWVNLESLPRVLANGDVIWTGSVQDITEHKLAESHERLTRDVLELLNRTSDTTDTISDLLKMIKKSTEFEAVAIRLRAGDDFPYHETNGFPTHFVEAERHLCTYDGNGDIVRDKAGNPVLECMCGNVICGRTNPVLPFFTENGSFWSNCTTELLATTTEKDRQANTRNRCNGEGYESVALIPLRSGAEIIGLLQLNDHRKDRFTIETIQFYEGIGAAIGIALSRKQTEEARRESEEKFRNLAELLPALIYEMDLNGKITYVNKYALKMTGYTSENFEKGFSGINLMVPEDRPEGLENIQRLLNGRSGSPNEYQAITKDGKTFPVLATSALIMKEGKPVGLRGILFDITDRKKAEAEKTNLEDQLRQSQKLEAIGQLASGVAHDFNNLLGGIMGHSELLKMKLDADSDLRCHADRIFTACTKAADLTRQLLSFARKAPAQIMDVDMNSVIKQVVDIMERTIDRRIEISTMFQDQLPLVSGDANQLENALLNIAINARDAMPEGGRLRFGSKTVTPDQTLHTDHDGPLSPGPYVMISIADSGIGMSSEIRERIFEPFFTTKGIGKGTGLGLASVYGCIKQHNGHITVQSQEGEGTQFEICIPVASAARPVADAAEGKPLAAGKGTLLVIDDEQVYHEVITETFQDLGYTVYSASDGADAVAFYREHQSEIDVVVLDMNMPKMSGQECFRRLKKTRADVKVIVASGYGDNADRQKMQNEGALAFVQKPYQLAELGRKIAELMDSNG